MTHGLNVIEIKVLNEKNVAKTYTINITIADDNADFSNIRIGNNDYNIEDFDSNNTLTLDDVLYSINNLHFVVTKSSNYSSIEFNGNYITSTNTWLLYNSGNNLNEISFTIKSEDGQNENTFIVKVKRLEANKIALLENLEILLNNNNLLDQLENYTLNDNKNINLRVDRGSNQVIIKAYVKPEDRSKLTGLGEGVLIDNLYVYTYEMTLTNGIITNKNFEITSEDGSTINTFKINVLSKNNINEITNLKIYDGTKILYEGNFEDLTLEEIIPYGTNQLRFVVTKEDFYSRIFEGGIIKDTEGIKELTFDVNVIVGENNTIVLRSTPEITQTEAADYNSNYDANEITITYNKTEASNIAELDNLEVLANGENILLGFDKTITIYQKLLVTRDIDRVTVVANPGSNGTILVGSNVGDINLTKHGSRIFTITVVAENGINKREYTIEIFNQNDIADVIEIDVDGEIIEILEDQYNYELSYELPYTKRNVNVSVNTLDEFSKVTIEEIGRASCRERV